VNHLKVFLICGKVVPNCYENTLSYIYVYLPVYPANNKWYLFVKMSMNNWS